MRPPASERHLGELPRRIGRSMAVLSVVATSLVVINAPRAEASISVKRNDYNRDGISDLV